MFDITADFPLITHLRAEGRSFVYLDNAATTQKPRCVIEAMTEWYTEHNANPHRGTYVLSKAATDAFEFSRQVMADHIHARKDEVVFCRNATEALNMVALAFAPSVVEPGDTVAIPISEHHSNLLPWQHLCKQTGAHLVYILCDDDGRLPDSEIESKIDSRTKLVACAQVGNVLGMELPIRKLADRAHEVGAYLVVDCAQGLLHRGIDVSECGADFAAFSAHKAFGPNGIGVLWGRYDLLDQMPPFLRGGETVIGVTERRALFEKPPMRFEGGTQDPAGAYAFAAALDYLECLGQDRIVAHERELTKRLLDGMRDMPKMVIYGARDAVPDKGGIISFNIAGQSPLTVAGYLDMEGVTLHAGTHCAQPLLAFLGASATCRVSLAPYNTIEDVDYFLDRLDRVYSRITNAKMKGR